METDFFSAEGQIKSMCKNSLQRGVIDEDSLMGISIRKTFPNQSITEFLKNKLTPKYLNSTFTWFQIETAFKKA